MKKQNLKFKESSRVRKKDASKILAELERLYEKMGELQPAVIVKQAESPKSPLHNYFQWDDSHAGHQYRLHQARSLIGWIMLDLQYGDEVAEARAFVNVEVPDNGGTKTVYLDIVTVENDADLRQQNLKNALKELIRAKEKYRIFNELSEIFVAVDKVQKKLDL